MSHGAPPPTPPQTGVPIASQPFPGSLTPGWNDPPPLQCNPLQTTTTTAGRTKLNKRVPFPLGLPLTGGTKPTAIVQPSQTTAQGASGSCGNIAVVHPMQHPNQMTPSVATSAANPSTSTLTALPIASCASSTNVPTMSVPAVPRQNSANQNFPSTSYATSSTIQHI